MKKLVALQGRPGAYSHMSAVALYPELEPMFCTTFEDVFSAVESGEAAYGVIPVENSTAGRVSDVHPILETTPLHIIGEYFLPVEHCLIGLKGADIKNVTESYSHIQGLMQCDGNLKKNGIQRKTFSDTAGAAEWLAAHGAEHQSAIASALAAEIHGLDVLQTNFQDTKHNTTRFLIFSADKKIPEYEKGETYITSLIFNVGHIPAALYKALGGFATNGVNITKLESYLDKDGRMQSAKFYVDVQAHPEDESMKYALDELNYFSNGVKVLGTYIQHEHRTK